MFHYLGKTSGIQKGCSELKGAGASAVLGTLGSDGESITNAVVCSCLTMSPRTLQERLSLLFSAEGEEQRLSTGWLDSRVTHRVLSQRASDSVRPILVMVAAKGEYLMLPTVGGAVIALPAGYH